MTRCRGSGLLQHFPMIRLRQREDLWKDQETRVRVAQMRTLSDKENFLRAIEFRCPEWVPIVFELLGVAEKHGPALGELMLRHPLIFDPERARRANAIEPCTEPTRERRFTDDWGCEWLEVQPGIIGQVVGHPLSNWSALDDLRAPDPDKQWDWDSVRKSAQEQRARGELVNGYMGVVEGGFFDRLQFLRGLDNLLMDLLDRPPELEELIRIVLEYNMKLIRLWLDAGVDVLHFHGDIGMQNSLMMRPETFREALKPAYRKMFQACRKVGVHVKYSSDGNLLEIVDDLVECGASYHDPQVRPCTIDGIAQAYNGKLCAMVDIDEQMLPFCTPQDIDDQIREIFTKIGTPDGGLMLFACVTADVPLENIEAICTAWESHEL